MIDLYYWPTPNGRKVAIMLEECELKYNLIPVDIGGGDQFKPAFLRISPNNRIPAIVDHSPLDGDGPISIFESGAILEYLADKEGKFLPRTPRGRSRAMQWVYWQTSNLGPMMGNVNHFRHYAKDIVEDLAQLEYSTQRFMGEVDRLAGVMDAQLSVNEYLAGNEYSIADIITWPWATLLDRMLDASAWSTFPNVKRWGDAIRARPAVARGHQTGQALGTRELTPEEETKRRGLLFNQTNAKIRKDQEESVRSSS